MRYSKMHGCGNDYVLVDGARERVEDPAALARRVSERRHGIGADGLILVLPSAVADFRMRIWNADGSEAEMCGNGIRCLGKFVHDHGLTDRRELAIETAAGTIGLALEVEAGRVASVRVDLGPPRAVADDRIEIDGEMAPFVRVSMGNPHAVFFVEGDPTDADVVGRGPRVEHHAAFPDRTNVAFVRVLGPEALRVRVWERGSGETLACGTGAAASVVAAAHTGRCGRRVSVQARGGTLDLHWSEIDGRVYLTGPAVEVCRGEWLG